ncbi:pyridoxamine 5'-phosphate oxidase family protein [Mariniluteicoccus flavus]
MSDHGSTSDQSPVTRLDDAESWELLRSERVGRLATSIDRQPEIFPVNFVVDGDDIVFRTAQGSKLFEVVANDHVAFEVDRWDEGESGWSVVCTGRAARVESQADADHCDTLGLRPWVAKVKTTYVRIHVTRISGRRFVFGDEPEL